MTKWKFTRRILACEGCYATLQVRPDWRASRADMVNPRADTLKARMAHVRATIKPMTVKPKR